ncbi:hypothetical protein [Arthrobacter cavernae]|uniref:DUF308 domain-containing protein n=1 Tax=Arthrobacter cavernae TaxID=2817681 RepID=A0A939HIM6_9MICC|nr:hypothetical protein [Arthrobacter cavernae]MBO1268526.1 hypothetical protein [Arthrobacter cavernae]
MNRPDPNSADQSANNDDDAVWLDLVARLEATPSAGPGEIHEATPPEPVSEEPARASFRDFDPLGLSNPAAAEDAPPAPGPRDHEVDGEEGFVPEEPPSLAGTEPLTMLAWLGAIGGPLALVFTAMFWRSAPLVAILGIVAAFVASVVYLIMKLPQEKNEDDDGARI